MIKEREDVIGMIKGFGAESAGRRMIMQHSKLSVAELLDHEFHLRWNAEIVEKLTQFLLAPTEFGSPTEFGR